MTIQGNKEEAIIGNKRKKSPHFDVYVLGGGYCSRCRMQYSFMELYLLLQKQRKTTKQSLPRCPYCNMQVRISSHNTSHRRCGNFWKWVDYFEKNRNIR